LFGIFIFHLFWEVGGRQKGHGGEDIQSLCQTLFDRSTCNEIKHLDKFDPLVLVNKVCSNTENKPVADIPPG